MEFIRQLLIETDDSNKLTKLKNQLQELISVYAHADRRTGEESDTYNKDKRSIQAAIDELSRSQKTTPTKKPSAKDRASSVVDHWEKQLIKVTKRASELEKNAPPKGQTIAPSDTINGKKRHQYLHAVAEVNIVKRELKDAKSKLTSISK